MEQFVNDVKHHQALEKILTTPSIGFNSIEKKTCSYSITNKLLEKLLTVDSRLSIISVGDIRIIKHTKKKLHSSKIAPMGKETITFRFHNVDGAEVCELVGLYLLSQLQHLDIYVGLYLLSKLQHLDIYVGHHIDDGLATHRAITPKCGEN